MREVVATLFSSVDGYATGRDAEDMDWAVDHRDLQTSLLRLGLLDGQVVLLDYQPAR
jgi:hypothetical protein